VQTHHEPCYWPCGGDSGSYRYELRPFLFTHPDNNAHTFGSLESETFDLGGQSVSTITNTIQSAFSKPLSLGQDGDKNKMIRLTFVTGAGKLGRQKYDPDAAKAVTSTLRDLGYEEDRGASCVVECAGSFKLQHDTGKNLKTVVVFPKIEGGTQDSGRLSGMNNLDGSKQHPTILEEGSPEHMIATSSMTVFQRMLSSKCPSWSQKKGCAAALESLSLQMAELDAKLVTGTPLDPAEQDFYDTVSHLEDKEEHVRTEMHNQVEREDITAWELELLSSLNAERIAALQNDKSTKKPLLDKALQRKKVLTNMVPKEPHNLRHEATIRKLRKELLPFLHMEEEQKGRLRSVKETQVMARKEELELEIAALEEDSRGWFEDEEAFQSRVAASRASFALTHSKPKVKKVAVSSAGGGARKTVGDNQKWVLPGDVKKGIASGANGSGPNKKKNKSNAGTVFGAMMIDDDDDDDDDDDTRMKAETKKQQVTDRSAPVTIIMDRVDAKKTASGARKKKKGKKQDHDKAEDRALDQAFAQEQKAKRKKEEEEAKQKQVAHPAIAFVRDYVLPILAAFITWFATFLVGKPKKRKEKGR
jgi:hypothetical protein